MAEPTPPRLEPSHHDLLLMAASLRDAVVQDDSDQIHTQLRTLRSAVDRHIRSERRTSGHRSTSPLDRLVADGQDRLLSLLDDVLSHLPQASLSCTCLVRSAEIELALRRQAALENRVADNRRQLDRPSP